MQERRVEKQNQEERDSSGFILTKPKILEGSYVGEILLLCTQSPLMIWGQCRDSFVKAITEHASWIELF